MKTMLNWISNNKKSPWFIIGAVAAALLVVMLALGGGDSLNLSGAAGATTVCDTAEIAADPSLGMIITTDGMMVRTGPNINYENVDPNHPTLTYCATFEMLGRNADGSWLYVQGKSVSGWIFYDVSSEKINININDLPVMNTTSQQRQPDTIQVDRGFHVTIENNVAYVTISDLPANKAFYVRLRPDGFPNKEINFYQGVSNSNGDAQFQQALPFIWEDGSPVEYGRLVMDAYVTKTKALVGTVLILYSR